MSRRVALLVLAVLLLALTLPVAAGDRGERQAAFLLAQEPLRAQDWPAAVELLRAFRNAHPDAEEALEAWVLEARALLLAGAAEQALASTSAFLAAHGETAWVGRMKHTAADAYAALGRPGDSAEVLRERVDAATAPAARAAIGALHLKLADDDFDGVEVKDDLGRALKRRNLVRALASYRHALAVGVKPEVSNRVRERIALTLEELKKPGGAVPVWDELLTDLEKGRIEADADARVRWLVGRSRAQLRENLRADARRGLREALELHPSGAHHMEILLLLGEERLGNANDDVAFEEAVAWFRRAVLEHRDDERAVKAQLSLAEAYELRGRSEHAAAEWGALVERFPEAELVPVARDKQAQALFRAGRFDDAVRIWERFLAAHPNHPLWQRVRQRISDAAFAKGAARAAKKDPEGAVAAWRSFAEEYPTDKRAPAGLLVAGTTLRQAKNAEGAIQLWRHVAGRYAKAPEAAEARWFTALTLEDDLTRLEDAVKAYEDVLEKHPGTSVAAQATVRLDRLKAHHLELRLERVVGTKDVPVVRVSTRNLPALDVRVYRLEMEEYFRRKGTVRGVENLQLEVVKPDLQARWELEDYAPFALMEADREVPAKEPGAYVIVAGDEHLTATLLFVVSDVEAVVKKARGSDLFVWAFERSGQAPAAGARVLVAEGAKVREVGRTGADGVWQGRAGSAAKNILVVADGGFASTELGEGTAVASGFQSKAYVYTDRPVYRPGQKVNWRAIFLKASGGAYVPPSARKGKVVVSDARGQAVFETAETSSPFGTFSGDFQLDGAAPLGVWKVQLQVRHVGSWTGEFEVQEFRKPEFTLELVPRRPVYLTGEKVEATAKLLYAFGGPVADADLVYEVFRTPKAFKASAAEDHAWYFRDERRDEQRRRSSPRGARVAHGRSRTDDGGTAVIEFETGAKDEDAEYLVRVAVEDVTGRWIVDQDTIPVTRSDHMAVVKADRKVYRPGQEMRVEVRTVDAGERPVARSGSLLLLEVQRRPATLPPTDVERRGGRPREVKEEEIERAAYPLTTGADGTAELRVKVPEPGRWRLRWRATDGRGSIVTAYADVEASGEALDLTRDARLVAAQSVYTEGDEAEVMLQSPVTGVKALLTYEGERVLAYRFVDVKRGSTLLSLPVGGRHAPNVFFKVAIPGKDRLLEADTEVVVLRFLQVQVELPRASGPGEEVDVRVRTTDARGQPVAAEVGLALIDETLFAIASDRAKPIRPFFYDRRRVNAVQTGSSLGFRAFGTTRETNKDLLADEAARSGDVAKAMAASALQGAKEALARRDHRMAATLALRAADADPASYEARVFLAELRDSREARKALASSDKRLLDALAETAALEPSASPTPMAPGAARPSAKGAWGVEGEEMEDEDAPFDGPATNATIGLGGGAGGAFSGRGGRRSLKARGGGARRARESQRAMAGGELLSLQQQAHRASFNKDFDADAWGFGQAFATKTRRHFADVAAWDAHLVTNAEGEATHRAKLPDNLTTWRAVVRGVSKQALVGEGRGRVLSRRDLHVRLDTPRFLVQGDLVSVPNVIHNQSDERLDVRESMGVHGAAKLKGVRVVDGSDVIHGDRETYGLPAGGLRVSTIDLNDVVPGTVRVEASAATTQGPSDRVEVTLPALPRGIKVVEGRTGVVATDRGATQETFLDVPEGAIPGATRLAVVLYPGLDAALLDALLYLDVFPYGCIEQTVHRFLPALDARAALLAAGSPSAARLQKLDEAVRRGAMRLRNLQRQDGSFGWFRGGRGNLAMTAYALLGLAAAREAGIGDLDATITRAADALAKQLKAGDEDARALGHYALARVGRLDQEGWATTFRRRRDDLSVPGLAWMALAAARLGRDFDADELAGLLLERRVEEQDTTHWKGKPKNCFVGSDREATGLAVQALLVVKRESTHSERGLRWLVANRTGGGFGSTKDTAAFVSAAAAWVLQHGAEAFGGSVELLLDGDKVRTIDVGPEGLKAKDRRFLVAQASTLEAGRHRLVFRLRGQGRLSWAARLETVVASEELPADEHGLGILRTYLKAEEAPVEGQPAPVKPGYSILREAARPRIESRMLSVVGSGDRVLVRLELNAPRELDYVLIEDPLPAGFDVLEGTSQGTFDWQERRDNRQVFFCTRLPKGKSVFRYVLQATHWGRFTALGTTAYPMYLPEVNGRAQGHVLTVAEDGTREADVEVPPTPDELYARARKLFDDQRLDQAVVVLRELRDEQPLRDEIVEEIETYLLRAAIEKNEAQEIVRAREALVRRNPSRIPSDWRSQRSIGFAYDDIGEDEVAAGLYRDLVARGFGLQVDWMQTLTARGREVDGLDALNGAMSAFPVSNATAAAAFRRSQRYRELPRPEGRDLPAGRPMDAEGLAALRAFTAHFAETRLADPANYAIVGALRRAGDLVGAADAAEAFLARFPGSRYEDDARYFLAESRFRTFEADPAAKSATAVVEAATPLVERKFPGAGGRPAWSEFRTRAYHLLARVAHVQGDLDRAIQLYWQARELEDAREAHAFLTEERLELEETLVVPLEGVITLPVRYRNVGEVAFKAYPVDLQVLFAVRKTLVGLHDIDLSGIMPTHQWTARFEDAGDHMGHVGTIRVPADVREPGAWLVVAKAGDHEAKTLVVKTDLRVVLQRIGEKVRVYVTDGEGRNVKGAYVTVADGQRMRARGLTDGRGVFEAPGVGAEASVVVSKDDRFAIAR